jgi:Flp pilus assembly protein TadG
MSGSARNPTGARKRPLAFWRDRRGAAAVEFAFIAPVLIIMYCGLVELSQAMMAQRRASNVASTIGDLVAQSTQTGPAMIGDIFNVGNTIMAPFPISGLKMCVASVVSDATGKDTVAWSQPNTTMTNCPAPNAVLTNVPTGVLPASQSVIMAKVRYDYTSPIKLVMPRTLTFYRTYYLRPRKSDSVLWSQTN